MEQLLRKLRRLRAEEEQKLWRKVVELLELGEEEGAHLTVELYGETHFSVFFVCHDCGYRSHIATLLLDAPTEVWRSAILAGAEDAYRRLSEHSCYDRGGVVHGRKSARGNSQ